MRQADGTPVFLSQVSIHALRFQRAMRRPIFSLCAHRLVSIHALRFQRAMRLHRRRDHDGDAVSIHALRFQRAMPKARTQCVAYTKFQSTPSVSRGRCRGSTRMRFPWASFNPRPPFPEGDAGWLSQQGRQEQGFNPRPPFPEGDAGSSHLGAQIQDVSIHALRFQRAMPGTGAAGEPITWFQSTPSVSRGRCAIAPRMIPTESMFQSTPSVSRGRCHAPSSSPTTKYSFNPRPPFPEGDARRPSGSI